MFDVYGLGNALVDEEYKVDDGFLRSHELAKGHMTLVEESQLDGLVGALSDLSPKRMSGGSAANTMTAVQAFGGSAFYSCKVADDATGNYFLDNMSSLGVTLTNNAKTNDGKSGRCLVLVTPDAERTMNTFLGISGALGSENLDESALRNSSYYYVEGYLSSSESALDAAVRCRELAEAENVKVAVTLSDPSMVQFFGDNLRQILGNGVDLLFCNEEEALTFTNTDRIDIAANELADIGKAVNITLGAKGSLCVSGHSRKEVAGYPATAVDTNGAGDIYAGACLYGLCHGMDQTQAAAFANYAAAHLVQRYGARLETAAEYQQLLRSFA